MPIRPAKLPENCNPISNLEDVYAVGNGHTVPSDLVLETDGLLRQASFRVMPCALSGKLSSYGLADAPSIICASSVSGQSLANGDSGE